MFVDIVLFSAKQGGGKTTTVENLYEIIRKIPKNDHYLWGAVKLNFADVIYEMHDACRNILKKYDVEPPHKKKDGNLLQLLGTEWGRNTIHPDIWVEVMANRIDQAIHSFEVGKYDRLTVLIGDCRFKNEFDAFPEAFKVRLECPEPVRKKRVSMWRENSKHPSEVDLDEYLEKFDLIIDTESSPEGRVADMVLRCVLNKSMGQNPVNSSRQ